MYIKQEAKHIFTSFAVAAMLFFGFVNVVKADGIYGQYGQYGDGSANAGKIIVDKLVRDPKSGEYVDNLGLNNAKYVSQNAVFFKIIVQNTGESTLSKVEATDFLPPYLEYVSGGTYNNAARQVTFTFEQLRPGEKRTTVLQTRVVTINKLPADKGVLCPVNRVEARTTDNSSYDDDAAQFCIEKKIMAETVPQTGDPIGLLVGFGALPTLLAGLKLRKKAV